MTDVRPGTTRYVAVSPRAGRAVSLLNQGLAEALSPDAGLCWGGPSDGLLLRPVGQDLVAGILAPVVVVVRGVDGETRYSGGDAPPTDRPLGVYQLEGESVYRWAQATDG